jgi:hypothetical protein
MLATPDYERLLSVAGTDRLRLVLVGDHRQLAAVGRGGMFSQARDQLPTVELEEIHRFTAGWESAASLALRAGDPAAIDAYEAHGRVRHGTSEEMTEAILTDWWQAWQAGNSHAFSAPTNDQVRYLNARPQHTRLTAGELRPGRALRNSHDEVITTGDVVATRQNAPQLRLPAGDYVRNRDTWTVTAVDHDGALLLRNQSGAQVAIPVGYAQEHVELAYFRTTHGVQGITERVGGTLVDETAVFRSVYVGMTRGRHTNTAYVDNDEDPRAVLERALGRDRADLGALAQAKAIEEAISREHQRREHQRIPDPLRFERRALGHDRAAALPAHTAVRPELESLTDAELRELRDRLITRAVPLDRITAARVTQLEQERAAIEQSIRAAAERAAAARAALDTAPRRERAARRHELDAQLRTQAALSEQLDKLDRRLHTACTAPNAPDTWLNATARPSPSSRRSPSSSNIDSSANSATTPGERANDRTRSPATHCRNARIISATT